MSKFLVKRETTLSVFQGFKIDSNLKGCFLMKIICYVGLETAIN